MYISVGVYLYACVLVCECVHEVDAGVVMGMCMLGYVWVFMLGDGLCVCGSLY